MSLSSSLQSLFGSPKPVTAGLAYFDPTLGQEKGEYQAFQYFPEKITDNKAVEYASKLVPGASHPIYTFIAGGERTISFDAIFCNDKGPSTELFAERSLFSKDRQDVCGDGGIPSAIAWLRKAMYPTYEKNIAFAPPLVIVYLPNSKITGQFIDQIVGILTRADVTYESFHRDGTPRLVVVSIEIKEVVQTSPAWEYHDNKYIDADIEAPYKRTMIAAWN